MAITTPSVDARPPEVRHSFQFWQWLFMRLSGVVLLFLALGHLAIQHVFNDVGDLDYNFVVARWSSTFWRTWDWLLLVLAAVHGVNGVRVLIHDYVRTRTTRLAALSLLYVVGFFTIVLGTVVVLTFRAGT